MLIEYLRKLPRLETTAIVALLLVVLGLWAFIELADEVTEGDTQSFDEALVMSMRVADDPTDAIGPSWLEQAATDITALGGLAVVFLVTIFVVLWCLINRYRGNAVYLAVSVSSGVAVAMVLKALYDRPRPQLVRHMTITHTQSFPSGHAMTAAIVYLTLAVLVMQVTPRRSARLLLLTLAIMLTVLIGVSRVYLGVHYPTDVLAGWALGLVWAAGSYLIAHQIWKRTGKLYETPTPDTAQQPHATTANR